MKTHLLNFSKIFAKSTFKFVLLFAVGLCFCIVTFFISLTFFSGKSGGNAMHGGGPLAAILLVFTLFAVDFWGALLFFASILVFPTIYFIVAQKTGAQTAIYLLCKTHLTGWIAPIIEGYVTKIGSLVPTELRSAADWTLVRIKLLEANKNDKKTPRMQRRVVKSLLKKMKLDDVDLNQSNLTLPGIIVAKINNAINDAAQPSYKLFLLAVSAHLLLTITAVVMETLYY